MGNCFSVQKDQKKNSDKDQNKNVVTIDPNKLGAGEEPTIIVPDDYQWSK